VDKLMQAGCFKEAQVLTEGLLLLGKRLMARTPGGTLFVLLDAKNPERSMGLAKNAECGNSLVLQRT
jgi:hypothetical protein